jgi:prolyl-tRNA synthetase
MGTYGIGLGRLLAAAIEQNHDDKGIVWPLSIAPYQVYLCPLRLEKPDVVKTAEKVYRDLTKKHIEVLYDDRDDSPGVKFNDADLLGIPLRLTVSPRTLQSQSIELKWRKEKQSELLPLKEITGKIDKLLQDARGN